MLRHDYPGQICSIAKALEVVGERWTLLIVRDVMNGNRRFGELQRALGVARNVLSAAPAALVEEDILERRPYQESPERYEYFLTEKGLDLWPCADRPARLGRPPLARPRRPADADRPQGVRRRGQRPRGLRRWLGCGSPRRRASTGPPSCISHGVEHLASAATLMATGVYPMVLN